MTWFSPFKRSLAALTWSPSILLILIAVGVASCMNDQPLVRLADVDASITQDPKYFGSDNFMGRPIRGYNAQEVWLSLPAAQALAALNNWRFLRVFPCTCTTATDPSAPWTISWNGERT